MQFSQQIMIDKIYLITYNSNIINNIKIYTMRQKENGSLDSPAKKCQGAI